jgi:hypothetical protein
MASSDLFALIFTLAILGGILYVVFHTNKAMNGAVRTAKEKLESKGLHVSSTGIAVKTEKRFDREAYMDATQRGFVRALHASSVQKDEKDDKHSKRSISADHSREPSATHHHGEKLAHLVAPLLKRSHSHQDEKEANHRGVFWKGKHPEKEVS